MAEGDVNTTVVDECRNYSTKYCNCVSHASHDDEYCFDDNDTKEVLGAMHELSELYLDELSKRKAECQNVDCQCMYEELLKSWLTDLQKQKECILLMHNETQDSAKKILEELDRKYRQMKSHVFKCKLDKGKNKIVLDNLVYEKNTFEQQYKRMQKEIKEYDVVQTEKKTEVKLLEKDVEDLSKLKKRLGSEGCWDINDLQLEPNVYDHLFKGHSDIIGSPCMVLMDLCKQKTTEVVKKEELKLDIRVMREVILDKNREIEELKRKYESFCCKSKESLNEENITTTSDLELKEVKSNPNKVVISEEKNIQTIVQIPTTHQKENTAQ